MTSAENTFDGMKPTASGVIPLRTSDPGEAARLVHADGAVILTGVGVTAHAAVEAARSVFADKVRAIPEAAEVRSGGVMDLVEDQRPGPEDALGAHTDGFAYGDDYPDFFLLLCAQASSVGGDSFLVDGYCLLDALSTTTGGAALVDQMQTVPIDQTEEGMHRSISPLIGRARDGRLMVRRFPFQRPRQDSTDPDRDREMIERWDHLCRTSATSAPRYKLAAGEVAVIDNYRMLHGREPYTDVERLMWRVWVWTDAARAVPPGALASDSRYARAQAD